MYMQLKGSWRSWAEICIWCQLLCTTSLASEVRTPTWSITFDAQQACGMLFWLADLSLNLAVVYHPEGILKDILQSHTTQKNSWRIFSKAIPSRRIPEGYPQKPYLAEFCGGEQGVDNVCCADHDPRHFGLSLSKALNSSNRKRSPSFAFIWSPPENAWKACMASGIEVVVGREAELTLR
jgi:hypothetical protein